MAGSSLMLSEPGRFATAQRMAQAFAQSEMVPEALRGNMANCLTALMLADEMGESPLMVMQNIFFVKGRAGWQTQYMIARANRGGAFVGPLTWKTNGAGDDLSVTCEAQLRNHDGSPGANIGVTVSMAMAKADGWTRNEKYRSIPEQMLRWRSAAWFIRLYVPEVMFGLPTVDELEDTMKDVTPPKLGIDDFKPGRKPQPPAPVIEAAATTVDAEDPFDLPPIAAVERDSSPLPLDIGEPASPPAKAEGEADTPTASGPIPARPSASPADSAVQRNRDLSRDHAIRKVAILGAKAIPLRYFENGTPDHVSTCDDLIAALAAHETGVELEAFWKRNSPLIQALEDEQHNRFADAYHDRRAALAGAGA